MTKKRIVIVAGARPNFPKVAPLIKAFARLAAGRRPEIILVHTGQHYDYKMSQVFLDELGLPKPDHYLGAGPGTHARQTADIMRAFEQVLLKTRPQLVMVVGDVNSTLACALTAHKMGIKVAHVEAGLRSYDRTMPEEANRLLTDHLSDYLFVSCPEGTANLRKEGIENKKIFPVGNVMIDTLVEKIPSAKKSRIHKKLGLKKAKGIKPYCLVTLHRPSNVDDGARLKNILKDLAEISKDLAVVMPLHPRTKMNIDKFKLLTHLKNKNIICLGPLGYTDFLALEMSARLVITDSGGIQEETSFLGVPCFTIRKNTERPVTVKLGSNIVAGIAPHALLKAWNKNKGRIMKAARPGKCRIPLWDGKSAGRIVKITVDGL
ncbi:MAG: UDP-N-acetylglucosamine 2-epimerase (non-hydrolyzing) [Candidatus Edwardsbacteria bacterium]|nr:UDP-N-acetylglucosamine 2-epimerase (non-hydrolyzing) [Candidatus Edwardsbacteria bacterium]MBU2463243.1 UDP-N-acetylglucosamine 2-epimerase (non-hydrolyzing) [Candidatus Edwardsbacteria bacterium]MBU2594217.1 UDP-N-acetylglucosamine 2-epimerase (non-hydrolyzing) [Candidatus Edwardsbacteria bacterium]